MDTCICEVGEHRVIISVGIYRVQKTKCCTTFPSAGTINVKRTKTSISEFHMHSHQFFPDVILNLLDATGVGVNGPHATMSYVVYVLSKLLG